MSSSSRCISSRFTSEAPTEGPCTGGSHDDAARLSLFSLCFSLRALFTDLEGWLIDEGERRRYDGLRRCPRVWGRMSDVAHNVDGLVASSKGLLHDTVGLHLSSMQHRSSLLPCYSPMMMSSSRKVVLLEHQKIFN